MQVTLVAWWGGRGRISVKARGFKWKSKRGRSEYTEIYRRRIWVFWKNILRQERIPCKNL